MILIFFFNINIFYITYSNGYKKYFKDKIKEYIKNNNNIIKNTVIDELIIYDRVQYINRIIKNKIISLDYINTEGKTILYNIIKFNKNKILDIILEYNKKIIEH